MSPRRSRTSSRFTSTGQVCSASVSASAFENLAHRRRRAAPENRQRTRRERRLRALDHVDGTQRRRVCGQRICVTVLKVRDGRIARNDNRNHLDGGQQSDQHHGCREHQQPSSQRQPRRSARGYHSATSLLASRVRRTSRMLANSSNSSSTAANSVNNQ